MNPVKIYILLSILFAGLLVALFTVLPIKYASRLLYSEKARSQLRIRQLNALFVFILFLAVVFVLAILMESYRKPVISLSNHDGFEVAIPEEVPSIEKTDLSKLVPEKIFVDEFHTFYIKQPVHHGWKAPRTMDGLKAYLEKTGLETNRANAASFLDWNPFRQVSRCVFSELRLRPYDSVIYCLDSALLHSEYGNMLKFSNSTHFAYSDPQPVLIREPASLNRYRKTDTATTGIPIDTPAFFYFSMYFNMSVLDKKLIRSAGEPNNLVTYFFNHTIGLVTNVEKIIASENDIIWTGSFNFFNALFYGGQGLFRIHRWVRILENQRYLYVVEMSYSPDLDPDSTIWEDMKGMFESMGVVEGN